MHRHRRSRKCAHAKSAKHKLLTINFSDFIVVDLDFEEVPERWRGACGLRGKFGKTRLQDWYLT
jgi:hypothetical protein